MVLAEMIAIIISENPDASCGIAFKRLRVNSFNSCCILWWNC